MSREHTCPSTFLGFRAHGRRRRLNVCLEHPRWHVWKDTDQVEWVATAGTGGPHYFDEGFPTHAEAIQYATSRARAEALAAVQSAEGVTAR